MVGNIALIFDDINLFLHCLHNFPFCIPLVRIKFCSLTTKLDPSVAPQPSPRADLAMPSLMDLCPEVLEEVVLKLEEVEDVISLGSSSTDLARIVGQELVSW